jgi:hypothetical protein
VKPAGQEAEGGGGTVISMTIWGRADLTIGIWGDGSKEGGPQIIESRRGCKGDGVVGDRNK